MASKLKHMQRSHRNYERNGYNTYKQYVKGNHIHYVYEPGKLLQALNAFKKKAHLMFGGN